MNDAAVLFVRSCVASHRLSKRVVVALIGRQGGLIMYWRAVKLPVSCVSSGLCPQGDCLIR